MFIITSQINYCPKIYYYSYWSIILDWNINKSSMLMIYFLLNIIKNPHPPYWKILLFLRAAIIIPDKNGRLNFFKKIRKSMILDIAYISFLNCLQMTEIKVVEWNFPWKPIVTFRTSKRNSLSTKSTSGYLTFEHSSRQSQRIS